VGDECQVSSVRTLLGDARLSKRQRQQGTGFGTNVQETGDVRAAASPMGSSDNGILPSSGGELGINKTSDGVVDLGQSSAGVALLPKYS
jgi:hypothetical protein